MSLAYTRPFEPLDFADRAGAVFPLEEMIEQLRRESVYETAHRNALTLIRDEDLTVVLVVARQGTQCEDHHSTGPTFFTVLEGDVDVESADGGGTIHLRRGAAGALAPEVSHRIAATTDCAYMVIMGATSKSKEQRSLSRGGETFPTPADSRVRANRIAAPLSFTGEALLIGLVGFFLLFLIPPVGFVLLFLSATIAVAGGLAQLVQSYRNPQTRQRAHSGVSR